MRLVLYLSFPPHFPHLSTVFQTSIFLSKPSLSRIPKTECDFRHRQSYLAQNKEQEGSEVDSQIQRYNKRGIPVKKVINPTIGEKELKKMYIFVWEK